MSQYPNTPTNACPLRHIAFIMDGNGRWAKKRGMPREYGHHFGAEAFQKVMRRCFDLGVQAATFYVFSTENWKRPEKEVKSIIKLLEDYLEKCEKELRDRDIRVVFLGDKAPFSPKIQAKMNALEQKYADGKHILNLALNYGGRDELTHACNSLIAQGKQKITEDDIQSALYTADSPELDMIVRTGGDLRISNFLLWQAAYAELYFTDVLWPDFSEKHVDDVVENFMTRKRRYGGV